MTQAGQAIVVGPLEIHRGQGLCLAGDRAVRLTVREFSLLVALAERRREIVRREELFRRAWGGELRARDRSIDVYVHKLRVKLEDALPGLSCIHTHVGFGYRLALEPARSHEVHRASTPAQHHPTTAP